MTWNYYLLQYLISQSLPVVGVSGSSYSDPDFRIDYSEGATSEQKAQANTIASTYVVPPQPNPTAFLAACVADTTIQPLYYLLAPYYAAIENYAVNPDAVKLLWSQLITQYSSLLTSPIQTLIEGYAVTYNMPLT